MVNPQFVDHSRLLISWPIWLISREMLGRCAERPGNLKSQVRPALRHQLAKLDGPRMRSQTIDNFVTTSTHRINQPPLYYPDNGSMGTASGPLLTRHSGKGRAVPERCLSIQVFLEATPYQIIARCLGGPRCCRWAIPAHGRVLFYLC